LGCLSPNWRETFSALFPPTRGSRECGGEGVVLCLWRQAESLDLLARKVNELTFVHFSLRTVIAHEPYSPVGPVVKICEAFKVRWWRLGRRRSAAGPRASARTRHEPVMLGCRAHHLLEFAPAFIASSP